MVTAALSHCLINMIVLQIMLSVIYLCNIMGSVIVHVLDSYPACRMSAFHIFFVLFLKKKGDFFEVLNCF